jgi:ubiquinone/menaquinone biosynthesis C-methylase UbiE
MYDSRYSEEQEAKYKAGLDGLSLGFGSVVLDVGCGSGMFFSQVAGKAESLIGVDVSRGLLHLAKERAKTYPNISIILADADHLPLRRNLFSHVFAFTVLQNMPKPAQTLQELKLVAKKDACFVVTGLKAAVSLEAFGEILEAAGLKAFSLRNEEALRCYVVRAVNR